MNLAVGEAERPRPLAFVAARRSSAALNDDFVDIRVFQQLASDGIEAGPAERAGRQALHMHAIEMEDTATPRHTADDLDRADRRRDGHDHYWMIDGLDLDRDPITSPHIRDPRTICKAGLLQLYLAAGCESDTDVEDRPPSRDLWDACAYKKIC